MRKRTGKTIRREPVPPSVPAEPHLSGRLRDPAFAAVYLSAAAREDDPGALLQALLHVAKAQGGIGSIASKANVNRQQLYRTLSKSGNPELRTFTALLSAAGLAMEIKPARNGRLHHRP